MSLEIVKNRWLGFLIWQSIVSTAIFLSYKTLILSPFVDHPFSPSLHGLFSFLTFHLSLILFSISLFVVSSPQENRLASLSELTLGLALFFLKSIVAGSSEVSNVDLRRRARHTVGLFLFVLLCGVSGFLAVVAVSGSLEGLDGLKVTALGLEGLVFGLVYGAFYIYKKRWVLGFPIIQRPLFFSFKMGLPACLKQAIKISSSSFLISVVLSVVLPDNFKSWNTVGQFVIQQIAFYLGTSVVSLCWELSSHLLQVLLTRRCSFAPPQGSAAAETNPSEPLLSALEQSNPRSLFQYLAYLDLCIVCESNVDTWRRAAFFEETGQTYRRVVTVCLKPLEQLTSRMGEGLEGISGEKTDLLSQQLNAPSEICVDSRLHEAFNDFQLCAWCARTVSALTARSHNEDRYGVAQLYGFNASVVSTLLSCLIAVEACLGKKTNAQAFHLMGPANIKWATVNMGRRDISPSISSKRRRGALHNKAYAMADVLRTSMYEIVTVFQYDMQGSGKTAVLEKEWINKSNPLYGTQEILAQKLSQFLEFQAN